MCFHCNYVYLWNMALVIVVVIILHTTSTINLLEKYTQCSFNLKFFFLRYISEFTPRRNPLYVPTRAVGQPSVPCIGSLLIPGYTQVQIQYQRCGWAFSTLYRLTAHTRLNTGTDTVPELWSAFSALYRLTAHTRLHTGTDTVPELWVSLQYPVQAHCSY
jgi:hypothetical protein